MSHAAVLTADWNEQAQTLAPVTEIRFQQLVETYHRDLFRYAYWLSSDRMTAEDLVQETFLRAWKSINQLKQAKAIKGWLFTILRRENARRFERARLPMSETPLDTIADHHVDCDTSAEAFALHSALKKLADEYREPLVLQIIGGYSQKEIGQLLGLSSAGAGTRLFRARQKLREILERE